MSRRVAVSAALFVLVISATTHAANNFGFWTVSVLRSIDHQRGWPAVAQYDAVVVHRSRPMRQPDIAAPGLSLRTQIDTTETRDPYPELRRLYRRKAFHCIVISNLEAPELVMVEQFARDFNVVIVATTREVRSAPFAVLPERDAVYGRSEAYTSYGFKLKPMPLLRIVLLDRDPLSATYQPLIHCRPLRSDIDLKDWRAEEICYGNAVAKQRSGAWNEALLDLSVAVVLKSKEAFHHPRFAKGWGFASYHPHRDLAVLLSKFGQCDAVERALRRSPIDVNAKTAIIGACVGRTTLLQQDSRDDRIAWGGAEVAKGQSELLPPFAPFVRWSGLVTEQ